jgi:hypothetical protein
MPSAGFEPAIPAGEKPQTNPLEYMAADIGSVRVKARPISHLVFTTHSRLRHPLLLCIA